MKWLTGCEWLVFDQETDTMYCKDCWIYIKEKKKTNHLGAGTNNFKVEAVKDHESSQSHLDSLKFEFGQWKLRLACNFKNLLATFAGDQKKKKS